MRTWTGQRRRSCRNLQVLLGYVPLGYVVAAEASDRIPNCACIPGSLALWAMHARAVALKRNAKSTADLDPGWCSRDSALDREISQTSRMTPGRIVDIRVWPEQVLKGLTGVSSG